MAWAFSGSAKALLVSGAKSSAAKGKCRKCPGRQCALSLSAPFHFRVPLANPSERGGVNQFKLILRTGIGIMTSQPVHFFSLLFLSHFVSASGGAGLVRSD